MIRKLHKNTIHLLALFVLVPVLVLTVAFIGEPQRIVQFAQEFTEPPLYGCLRVGEGNAQNCASKLGLTTAFALTLHDRPLPKEATVYYGDRIKGSLKFTNVGDLPLTLQKIGLNAVPSGKKESRELKPMRENVTLAPQQTVSINESSYLFKSPDPNKEWTVSSKITTTGGEIPTADAKQKITVNASCTALRIKELTSKDKTNIKNFCGKNPNSKLCTSKQYCEIFKGANCNQPNLFTEKPGWQCDQNVYLPAPEQQILEELCKVYPDTDACKKFCDRTVGSSLCPKKYIVIDVASGKPVQRIQHPNAVYIHDIKNFPVNYPDDYIAKGFPKMGDNPKPSPKVMGVKTDNKELLAQAGRDRVPPSTNPLPPIRPAAPLPAPPPRPVPPRFQPGIKTPLGCIGTCEPPGQAKAPPAWGLNTIIGCLGTCGVKPAPAPNRPPPPSATCDSPGGARPAAGCPAPQGLTRPPAATRPEPSSLRPDGRGGFVDKNGRPVAAPAGINRGAAAGTPGSIFPCVAGQDPNNPNTQLCTNPENAEEGDEGYAPECESGRRDVNPNDDPQGAPQHSCCLDKVKYEPGGGFCGRKAGAYLVPAGENPRDRKGPNPCNVPQGQPIPPNCVQTDYFGKVCANFSWTDPDAHICKGTTASDGRPASQESVIAPYQNTPEGRAFGPKDPRGFPRGDLNPQNDCNRVAGQHTITLADGKGACVYVNSPECRPGEFKHVNSTQCTSYCPAGHIITSGGCQDPNAPREVGDNPDYKLESDPPSGYNFDGISRDPNVSPQEKNCRDRARYYDRNSNSCMPIWAGESQCNSLGYAWQQNTQSSAKPGTCKLRNGSSSSGSSSGGSSGGSSSSSQQSSNTCNPACTGSLVCYPDNICKAPRSGPNGSACGTNNNLCASGVCTDGRCASDN